MKDDKTMWNYNLMCFINFRVQPNVLNVYAQVLWKLTSGSVSLLCL